MVGRSVVCSVREAQGSFCDFAAIGLPTIDSVARSTGAAALRLPSCHLIGKVGHA